METQCEMILSHLQAYRGITDNEARDLYGVNRLASRIHDLRSRGHNISSLKREAPNRYGKMCHFVEYRLVKEIR